MGLGNPREQVRGVAERPVVVASLQASAADTRPRNTRPCGRHGARGGKVSSPTEPRPLDSQGSRLGGQRRESAGYPTGGVMARETSSRPRSAAVRCDEPMFGVSGRLGALRDLAGIGPAPRRAAAVLMHCWRRLISNHLALGGTSVRIRKLDTRRGDSHPCAGSFPG